MFSADVKPHNSMPSSLAAELHEGGECIGRVGSTHAVFAAWFVVCLYSVPIFGQSGTPLVADTFNRADSGALGVADTGQSWTAHHGTASIDAGTARLGSDFVLASLDSGTSVGAAEVRVTAPADQFWLIVRLANDTNYWRFGRWQGGTYQLQQIRANALGTPQIDTPAVRTAQPGDVLKCVLLNPGLTCSVNGTVVATTTDAFNVESTRVGLSGYLAPTARFDDFLVTGPVPDLIVRLEGPLSAYGSGAASWTATLSNRGAAPAQAPELRLQPPAGLTNLIVSGATCTYDGTLYRCSFNSLASQAEVSITISLPFVPPVPSLTFTATAPAVAGETDSSQNVVSFTTVVRPPLPPDTVVVDTFERPNGTVLTTADTGQAWVNYFEPITISQGQAAASSGFALSAINAGVSTSNTSVTLMQPAQEFWLVVRLQDSQNYWRFGRSQNQAYQLQQIVLNGLGAPAVTTLATVMPAAGDALSCKSIQTLLECAVNGVPVVRTASTAGNTATRVGFSTYQSSAVRFDDLVVAQIPPRRISRLHSRVRPSATEAHLPVGRHLFQQRRYRSSIR